MKRGLGICLIFMILLVVGGLCGLVFGSARLSLSSVIEAFLNPSNQSTSSLIVWDLRLPRVLAAVLAGAGLAVAGLLLQSATGNDLCSPNVMGINAGAGLAVMIFLCLLPGAFKWLPLAAFVGALVTTLGVLSLSFVSSSHRVNTTILLAGVAVGTLLNAGISFLSQLYPDALVSYTAFSVGGFSGIHEGDIAIPSIVILLGIAAGWVLTPQLNLFCLGDDMARTLGVRVKMLRFVTLLLASALCAAVVSFAGLLGFVGLVVPHMARKLVGHDLRILVPVCTLLGALLVVVSDLAGRTLAAPAELPAGILMSMIGAPFFLFLLLKRRQLGD